MALNNSNVLTRSQGRNKQKKNRGTWWAVVIDRSIFAEVLNARLHADIKISRDVDDSMKTLFRFFFHNFYKQF